MTPGRARRYEAIRRRRDAGLTAPQEPVEEAPPPPHDWSTGPAPAPPPFEFPPPIPVPAGLRGMTLQCGWCRDWLPAGSISCPQCQPCLRLPPMAQNVSAPRLPWFERMQFERLIESENNVNDEAEKDEKEPTHDEEARNWGNDTGHWGDGGVWGNNK